MYIEGLAGAVLGVCVIIGGGAVLMIIATVIAELIDRR